MPILTSICNADSLKDERHSIFSGKLKACDTTDALFQRKVVFQTLVSHGKVSATKAPFYHKVQDILCIGHIRNDPLRKQSEDEDKKGTDGSI